MSSGRSICPQLQHIVWQRKTSFIWSIFQIRRVTRTINISSSLNCSISFDQEKHILFGASVYTASSYKHNCTRTHSTSHTSLITTSTKIINLIYSESNVTHVTCCFYYIILYLKDQSIGDNFLLLSTTPHRENARIAVVYYAIQVRPPPQHVCTFTAHICPTLTPTKNPGYAFEATHAWCVFSSWI